MYICMYIYIYIYNSEAKPLGGAADRAFMLQALLLIPVSDK